MGPVCAAKGEKWADRAVRPLQTLRRKKNPPGETGGKGGGLILFM